MFLAPSVGVRLYMCQQILNHKSVHHQRLHSAIHTKQQQHQTTTTTNNNFNNDSINKKDTDNIAESVCRNIPTANISTSTLICTHTREHQQHEAFTPTTYTTLWVTTTSMIPTYANLFSNKKHKLAFSPPCLFVCVLVSYPLDTICLVAHNTHASAHTRTQSIKTLGFGEPLYPHLMVARTHTHTHRRTHARTHAHNTRARARAHTHSHAHQTN